MRQYFEKRISDGVEIEGRRTKVGSEVVRERGKEGKSERVDKSKQLDFRITPDRIFILLTVLFFPWVLLGESSDLERISVIFWMLQFSLLDMQIDQVL